MKCRQCGYPVGAADKFCMHCGTAAEPDKIPSAPSRDPARPALAVGDLAPAPVRLEWNARRSVFLEGGGGGLSFRLTPAGPACDLIRIVVVRPDNGLPVELAPAIEKLDPAREVTINLSPFRRGFRAINQGVDIYVAASSEGRTTWYHEQINIDVWRADASPAKIAENLVIRLGDQTVQTGQASDATVTYDARVEEYLDRLQKAPAVWKPVPLREVPEPRFGRRPRLAAVCLAAMGVAVLAAVGIRLMQARTAEQPEAPPVRKSEVVVAVMEVVDGREIPAGRAISPPTLEAAFREAGWDVSVSPYAGESDARELGRRHGSRSAVLGLAEARFVRADHVQGQEQQVYAASVRLSLAGCRDGAIAATAEANDQRSAGTKELAAENALRAVVSQAAAKMISKAKAVK